MKTVSKKPRGRTFVLCLKRERYRASLELRKVYESVSDPEAEERGLLRVIDESGSDYLYPAEYFAVIDLPEPVAVVLTTAT